MLAGGHGVRGAAGDAVVGADADASVDLGHGGGSVCRQCSMVSDGAPDLAALGPRNLAEMRPRGGLGCGGGGEEGHEQRGRRGGRPALRGDAAGQQGDDGSEAPGRGRAGRRA